MSIDISRKSFIKGSMAGTVAMLAMADATIATAQEQAAETEAPAEDETSRECDILVIGLGASGIMAAVTASRAGANVIAIDTAVSIDGTTNTMTSGAWAVGSKIEAELDPNPSSEQDSFEYFWGKTHYQANAKVLRNIVATGGRAIDMLSDAGMPFTNKFDQYTDPTSPTYMDKNRHFYGLKGPDRGEVFQKMLDEAGVQCLYETTGEHAIIEEGAISGVHCTSAGVPLDIRAKAVICCAGGFLANPDMVAQYFGGAYIYPLGTGNSKGGGITIALEAGAQMGKNFSLSMNEYGAANPKTTPAYAFRHNIGENETLRLPVLGGLLVDSEGNRFVNEGIVCEEAMFTGEPLIRDSHFYGVYDTAFLTMVSQTPLLDMMESERMNPNAVGALTDVTDTDIFEHIDAAIEEGWCFKADTIEELAELLGLTHLVETVQTYNGYCSDGYDDQFFKKPLYLNSVLEPPFYVAEYVPSAWISCGGIKTDANCRALDANNKAVANLYVAGCDADIHSVPYFQGGSLNGHALSTGIIASETALEDLGL